MAEDWDNLIILDACRYDTFVEVYGKNCNYRISRGSSTPEFPQENFAGRNFRDTIYVTCNPWIDVMSGNSFYKIISLWKQNRDEESGTVLPEVVFDIALKIAEE